MLILYALTSFLSAALLFLVQPMIAKLLLPMLGGGPSVWNVCMVFFQAGLLAGYGYTHLLARRARAVRQVILHIAIVALTLLWLPIGLGGGTVPGTGAPFLWLLGALVASVGLPFFVLSTTGPLLQHWLASTDHPRAKDPYSLYAASNAGSLVGLLAFPALLEPLLRARTQAVLWSMGYLAFAGLVVTCGVVMVTRRAAGPHGPPTADVHAVLGSSIPMATRLRWLLLAFAPSSLLLGATLHITTDVAAIPLFWVVPLAVYLLTFIIAFSPRATGPSQRMSAALAIVALVAAASLWGFSLVPLWAKFPIHVLTVFTGGLVCHGQLARERPAPDRLTEF